MTDIKKDTRHRQTLNHLNRIEGQMKVLKKYIKEDKSCREIAELTASITQSFASLQMRTLEGYILHQLLDGRVADQKRSELESLLKLYKK